MGTTVPSTETMSVPKLYGPQKTGRDRVVGLGVEREGSIAPLSPIVPASPQPTEQVPDTGSTARVHHGPCLPQVGEQGSSRELASELLCCCRPPGGASRPRTGLLWGPRNESLC